MCLNMAVQIDECLSNKIANAGFVAALLVVTIHLPTPSVQDGAPWWFHQLIGGGVAQLAVSYFFLISGFLLGGHVFEKGWYARELLKRGRTLLVPYVIFSILAWCVSFVNDSGFRFDLVDVFGLGLSTYTHLNVLWYVRSLFCFVLVAPLIIACLRIGGGVFVAICYVLNQVGVVCDGFFMWTFRLSGLAMFALGLYLRMKATSIHRIKTHYVLLCAIVSVVLLSAKSIMCWYQIPFTGTVTLMTVPFLIVLFWRLIPEKMWPTWLVSSAFPIYLLHPFVLGLMPCKIEGEVGRIVLWFSAVLMPICFANLLRWALPNVGKIIFGGR